jgi:hypothetical protein
MGRRDGLWLIANSLKLYLREACSCILYSLAAYSLQLAAVLIALK